MVIRCFPFKTTTFSHFRVNYGFGVGIEISGVNHKYIKLIFRFRKFEDILFLDGIFDISCPVFSF